MFALLVASALAQAALLSDAPVEAGSQKIRREVPYKAGDPVPEGARVEVRPNLYMIGRGFGLAALVYVPLTLYAVTAAFRGETVGNPPQSPWLLTIPLAGPLIVLGLSDLQSMEPMARLGFGLWTMMAGLLEISGTATGIFGLLTPKTVLVFEGEAPQARAELAFGAPGAPVGISLRGAF